MGYLQRSNVKYFCFLFVFLVLGTSTSSFGWYTAVNTDSDSYRPFGFMRVDVRICNDDNLPLRILPVKPDANDTNSITESVEPNRAIIGFGTLTALNRPADTNVSPVVRRFALPLTGTPVILTHSSQIVSNRYVFIGLFRLDNNDIDSNSIDLMPDEIDDSLPNLPAGDYLLSCTIGNISGQKAIAQKVIRITDDRISAEERCLRVCSENQNMLKKVGKQNETIDQTTKQTLKNTNLHTLVLNRILQIVSRK